MFIYEQTHGDERNVIFTKYVFMINFQYVAMMRFPGHIDHIKP